MEIFLVGGAVRDFLLGKMNGEIKTLHDEKQFWSTIEKDWVVVGSTPEEMKARGYRQVGKSFPVFLHPQTSEEFALARTERKTEKGYVGFECYAQPDVTLEEDLKRRDLTINAIAMRLSPNFFAKYDLTESQEPASTSDVDYEIIDPYGGVNDLKNRVFRHVSAAFAEDPVRILRIARLACRFDEFQVNHHTVELMKKMTQSGEVDALVPERVWQEWSRTLQEKSPLRFFAVLSSCKAMDKLFPEIESLKLKEQPLLLAIKEKAPGPIRFAIEVFDMGQERLRSLVNRYRIPNDLRDLAMMVTKYYPAYREQPLTATTILLLFEHTDAFRRRERFSLFLSTCRYLEKGLYEEEGTLLIFLQEILESLLLIDHSQLIGSDITGHEIGKALRKIRLNTIERLLRDQYNR